MININAPSRYKVDRAMVRKAAEDFLMTSSVPGETVNIVFVGKRKMREIASTYKHEDVALPVLAFPFKEELEDEKLLGEVILCYPQVILLAAERGKSVEVVMKQLIEHGIGNLLK